MKFISFYCCLILASSTVYSQPTGHIPPIFENEVAGGAAIGKPEEFKKRMESFESWLEGRDMICSKTYPVKNSLVGLYTILSLKYPKWKSELRKNSFDCNQQYFELKKLFDCYGSINHDDPSYKKLLATVSDPGFVNAVKAKSGVTKEQAQDIQLFYHMMLKNPVEEGFLVPRKTKK